MGEIKELLYRAAKRMQTKVTLVANQALRTPRSEFIDSLMVPSGMNVADRRILNLVQPGWAFVEIVILWLAIVATTVAFFRLSKIASCLLVPYLAWVSFAAWLNFTIWRLNAV